MPKEPWEMSTAELAMAAKQTNTTPTSQKEPWEMSPAELAMAGRQQQGISPTLLASRQQASKSEAEANMPQSTPWSRARELVLGAAQGLGIDPLKGVPSSLGSMIAGIPELMTPRGQMNAVKGIGQNLVQGPQQAIQGIQEGDYDKMAGGVGQTISADLPAIYAAGKGLQAINPLATGADAATIKAIRNIRKLEPTTAEAQATAGRIANEAVQRESVPTASNLPVRDSKVFRNLLDAETELKTAKAAAPLTQQTVDGGKLLQTIDDAIAKEQVTGTNQAAMAQSGRAPGLIKIRNQIMGLMDNSGQIQASKLQQFKEIVDKDIFDHSGWKDTGTAADKSNLQALRDANGYVRQSLRDLGNTRLNAANDTYSHMSDVAKIVDIRRPDLAGLSTADKIPAALVPIKGTPAAQFARATLKRVAPYAITGGLGAEVMREIMKR